MYDLLILSFSFPPILACSEVPQVVLFPHVLLATAADKWRSQRQILVNLKLVTRK